MSDRDWLNTLRRASFRGVSFWVQTYQRKGGRRLVVHEFPGGESHYTEDNGRKAPSIPITAYVASDNVEGDADALQAAGDAYGSASLVLPDHGAEQVNCEVCERSFDKDKLGYIAFTLTFIPVGRSLSSLSIPALIRNVEWLATGFNALAKESFRDRLNLINAPGFVKQSFVNVVRTFAADYIDILNRIDVGAKAPQITRSLMEVYDTAENIQSAGEVPDEFLKRSFVKKNEKNVNDLSANLISDSIEILDEVPDQVAKEICLKLIELNKIPITQKSPTRSQELLYETHVEFEGFVRRLALFRYAVLVAQTNFKTRAEANEEKRILIHLIDEELEFLSKIYNNKISTEIEKVKSLVVEIISASMLDLSRVVSIRTMAPMSHLTLSYMLYGDISKADELAKRNKVIHPMFMPTDLEAVLK